MIEGYLIIIALMLGSSLHYYILFLFYIKSIKWLGERFAKKTSEWVFGPFFLIFIFLFSLPIFFSGEIVKKIYSPDIFAKSWSMTIAGIACWLISLIPGMIYYFSNKEILINSGLYRDHKK